MWKYPKTAKIKVSEGLKSWYRNLWAEYSIRKPKPPYNVIIPGYLTLICYLRYCRWPISQIVGPKSAKYGKMAKIKLSEAIKTWNLQLSADYLIRNYKSPYNVSIPGYLALICHLRCCRWPISQILGPKGVKISQNDQN